MPSRARWVAVLAVLALVAAACAEEPAVETTTTPPPAPPVDETTTTVAPDVDVEAPSYELVIGSVVSLSGAESLFGPSMEATAELALVEINKAIEAHGLDITVDLVHADDETTPPGAVAAARRLVAAGASCLIGPLPSATTIAMAEAVTIPEGIPNIATAATSTAINDLEGGEYVFRLLPSDALQGPALAQLIENELGDPSEITLSLAARDDAFGEGFIRSLRAAWEARGGLLTGEPVLYDPEGTAFDSEAQQIVSGDPDAWVIIDFPGTYAIMGAALLRTGQFDASRLFVGGGQPATIPDEVPFEAMEGARGTRPGIPQDNPALDAFFDLYEGTPGLPPLETFVQNNMDATILCFLASLAAGGPDPGEIRDQIVRISGPPGNEYTWLELEQAVADILAGNEINYQGVSGPIEFDDFGDPTFGLYDTYEYIEGVQTRTGQVEGR